MESSAHSLPASICHVGEIFTVKSNELLLMAGSSWQQLVAFTQNKKSINEFHDNLYWEQGKIKGDAAQTDHPKVREKCNVSWSEVSGRHTISHTCLGSPGTERGIFCRSLDKDEEEYLLGDKKIYIYILISIYISIICLSIFPGIVQNIQLQVFSQGRLHSPILHFTTEPKVYIFLKFSLKVQRQSPFKDLNALAYYRKVALLWPLNLISSIECSLLKTVTSSYLLPKDPNCSFSLIDITHVNHQWIILLLITVLLFIVIY